MPHRNPPNNPTREKYGYVPVEKTGTGEEGMREVWRPPTDSPPTMSRTFFLTTVVCLSSPLVAQDACVVRFTQGLRADPTIQLRPGQQIELPCANYTAYLLTVGTSPDPEGLGWTVLDAAELKKSPAPVRALKGASMKAFTAILTVEFCGLEVRIQPKGDPKAILLMVREEAKETKVQVPNHVPNGATMAKYKLMYDAVNNNFVALKWKRGRQAWKTLHGRTLRAGSNRFVDVGLWNENPYSDKYTIKYRFYDRHTDGSGFLSALGGGSSDGESAKPTSAATGTDGGNGEAEEETQPAGTGFEKPPRESESSDTAQAIGRAIAKAKADSPIPPGQQVLEGSDEWSEKSALRDAVYADPEQKKARTMWLGPQLAAWEEAVDQEEADSIFYHGYWKPLKEGDLLNAVCMDSLLALYGSNPQLDTRFLSRLNEINALQRLKRWYLPDELFLAAANAKGDTAKMREVLMNGPELTDALAQHFMALVSQVVDSIPLGVDEAEFERVAMMDELMANDTVAPYWYAWIAPWDVLELGLGSENAEEFKEAFAVFMHPPAEEEGNEQEEDEDEGTGRPGTSNTTDATSAEDLYKRLGFLEEWMKHRHAEFKEMMDSNLPSSTLILAEVNAAAKEHLKGEAVENRTGLIEKLDELERKIQADEEFMTDKKDDLKNLLSSILSLYTKLTEPRALRFAPIQLKDYDVLEFQVLRNDEVMHNEPYEFHIGGGWKVDFSTGIVATGLMDSDYFFDKVRTETTTVPDTVSILIGADTTYQIEFDEESKKYGTIREGRPNDIDWGVGFLAHFYPRTSTIMNVSVTAGALVRQQGVGVCAGGSVLLGKRQRLVLSGGAIFGKVKRLKPAWEVDVEYEEQNAALGGEVPYTETYTQFSYFFGFSYNFAGVQLSH